MFKKILFIAAIMLVGITFFSFVTTNEKKEIARAVENGWGQEEAIQAFQGEYPSLEIADIQETEEGTFLVTANNSFQYEIVLKWEPATEKTKASVSFVY